jgi:uncharacterized protein YndB with AHSA1/START domain
MAQTIEMTKNSGAQQPPPLKLTRTLHAARATVFQAWCKAEHVSRWFAPATLTVPEARIEPRVGGAWEVLMRMPDGAQHWTRGVIRELVEDARLVIEMRVEDGAGAPLFRALTEVDFSDALGGTRLDIVQTYTFENPEIAAPMVAGAEMGWSSSLDKMDAEVVRMQGGSGITERSVVHAAFHLERTYPAALARVWKALVDPAAKAKWFAGSPELELVERHMDVRVGGSERAKGRWKSGLVSTFEAIYHDVVPESRLVYSYVMHLDEKKISASLATMQLKPTADGKTVLQVTEQGAFFDGYDDAGARELGTGQMLDALGASLLD